MEPVYAGGSDPTELCTQNATGTPLTGYNVRGETLQTATGVGRRPRSFGTATRLDNGKIALTGGIERRNFSGQSNLELIGYTGTLGPDFALPVPRVFHDTAALPRGGLLVVGGMLPNRVGLAPDAHVFYQQ
jgi:hypothetical protein